MKKFVVIPLVARGGAPFHIFDTSHAVAIFMWGKDSNDWATYVRVYPASRDMDEFEDDLDTIDDFLNA